MVSRSGVLLIAVQPNDAADSCKPLVVASNKGSSTLDHRRQLAKLTASQRRLEIGHPVVEAQNLLFIIPGARTESVTFVAGLEIARIPLKSVVAERSQHPGKFVVVRRDRSALARRD